VGWALTPTMEPAGDSARAAQWGRRIGADSRCPRSTGAALITLGSGLVANFGGILHCQTVLFTITSNFNRGSAWLNGLSPLQRSRAALAVYDEIEIVERDWLICGLLWIAIGTLAVSPLGVVARVGRVLFACALSVHMTEAIYVTLRAWTAGLSRRKWFLRTMVLGSLPLLTMEVHLRKVPRRRSLK